MAECDLTFSTFSAGANSPTGVRKGWHAKVAGQLIGGKRYVGRTASAAATEPSLNTTKGHHSIIVDDCENNCKVYGSAYSRASDGLLKTRAESQPSHCTQPEPVEGTLFCGQCPSEPHILMRADLGQENSGCPAAPWKDEVALFVNGRDVTIPRINECEYICTHENPLADVPAVQWIQWSAASSTITYEIQVLYLVAGVLYGISYMIIGGEPQCFPGVFQTGSVCTFGLNRFNTSYTLSFP